MSATSTPWEELASELEEGMRRDLGGVRTRGAVRTRGVVRGGTRPTGKPSELAPIVVVEVPENQPAPPEKKVKKKLGLQSALDLYYVVHGKHWAVLGPREFNPDDEEHGGPQHLFLRNLKPEVVLVPAGKGRPAWCDDKTKVIEW